MLTNRLTILALAPLFLSATVTAGSPLAAAAATNDGPAINLRSGVHSDQFLRVFDEAKRAFEERRYEAAAGFNRAALKEAQGVGDRSKRTLEATLLAAKLESRGGHAHRAYAILRDMEKEALKAFGENSPEYADLLSEKAEAELSIYKYKLAEDNARAALKILEGLSERTESGGKAEYLNERGRATTRLARALSAQGFHQEARPYFAGAREMLSQAPGLREQDLADEMRLEAIYLRSIGDKRAGDELFKKSCQIRDNAADAERPAHILGLVEMPWESGSPRCQEIIDNDFPLRTTTTNKIRVAVTTIDLWELMAVMICVTNLDTQQRTVGFGDVKLLKVETDIKTGQIKQVLRIPEVNHNNIDRTRRELGIWSLTQDRPWLANMQKNRNMRGLVPNEGHDLFRGPNIFGPWREWAGTSHTLPMRVSALPSRENIYDRDISADVDHQSGLIRSGTGGDGAPGGENARLNGLLPITLEPFESRTGELFYIYPRGEDMVDVKVTIGNMIFSFPFQARKNRIR